MIRTSFFAKSGFDFNAVSIAGKAPVWFEGRQYKKLAPKFTTWQRYQEDGDNERYTREYTQTVLDKMDPHAVASDLGPDAVLCCWERPGLFCHRHIVADWLIRAGIKVLEI